MIVDARQNLDVCRRMEAVAYLVWPWLVRWPAGVRGAAGSGSGGVGGAVAWGLAGS
jgi:hypothetical protein